MKKLILISVIATLASVVACGCGKKDEAEDVKMPASATPDPNNPNVQNPAAIEGDGIDGPGKGKGGR